ncbi:MAG: SRPBCC family protein [bacterium]|nr:SRPBCC family protein [bacterium]
MPPTNTQTVTIEATVNAPIDKVWNYWTAPKHITQWNAASSDWHSPRAENDLKVGGRFNIRMEAKDGSFGFDFEGVYDIVISNKQIAYTMSDGRKVDTTFTANANSTKIVTVFDAESENPIDMQREGWQAILNNFKKYTESN